MPSLSHEGVVRLFYNRPALAAELLRDVLGVEVPPYAEARIESTDLGDIEPAARYADLVVLLVDGKPVLGIVVEVQLDVDAAKLFAWPAYLVNLRARLRCDVELLVVTPTARVARWAAQPIRLGQGHIRPLVVGPDGIPHVTDKELAHRVPELAVLSAIAHGEGPVAEAVSIASVAVAVARSVPGQPGLLYYDLVMAALSGAARAALEELMRTEGYEYQTEFARRYLAEGKAEGKAEALLMVLDARRIALSDDQRARILASTDLAEIERWLSRAPTVASATDLFA